jgi:hypothetical protein
MYFVGSLYTGNEGNSLYGITQGGTNFILANEVSCCNLPESYLKNLSGLSHWQNLQHMKYVILNYYALKGNKDKVTQRNSKEIL